MSERKEIAEEKEAERVYQSEKGHKVEPKKPEHKVEPVLKVEEPKKENPHLDAQVATAKGVATSFITSVGKEDIKAQAEKLKTTLEAIGWN